MFVRAPGLRALAFAVLVLLAGCTGSQLLTVNTDITHLEQEKSRLEQQLPGLQGAKRDAAVVQLAQIDGELERVANTAYASARQQLLDTKAKISYYRIAATADWQRRDKRAVSIAQEGTGVCNASKGYDIAPRDCAMLLVIPNLLVSDIWAVTFQMMVDEAKARGFAGGLAAKYRAAINDLVSSYVGLDTAAARIAATSVSPQMIAVIRSRRDTVRDNIDKFVELFITREVTAADHAEVVAICADIRRDAPAALPSRCNKL